jgi:microcin C transport system substrate-binding protein
MRGMNRFPSRLAAALRSGAIACLALLPMAAPAAEDKPADPPVAAAATPTTGTWVHAYASFGEPKYPRGFTHFDYVNPDAPKRGTLYLRNPDRRTSFDKFNPYTVKGNAPAGVSFMIEPLAATSSDEPQTMYGLLAQEMMVAPDKSSITFRLNPLARFHNGDPVTAEDVRHSFKQLSGPQAAPGVRMQLSVIKGLDVLDERTVRFNLADKSSDALFIAGGLPVFSRQWGAPGPGQPPKKFDDIVGEYPIGTGPYTIDKVVSGRRIEFVRKADYWARDLGVRRGFFNFDRIVYRYYLDAAVSMEAFKAGEFDLIREYSSRSWVRQHQGAKWRAQKIVKDMFETQVGQGLQSYLLNLRRPMFKDARVRQALAYTFDFDALNKLKLLKRANSLFNNSEFAADGLPSAGELKLLEPFRASLPPEVFGPAYRAPETGLDPKRLRANLLKARELFAQAGWKLADDGVMRDASGKAFEIEYLSSREENPSIDLWNVNLRKLGIEIKVRPVDFALYRNRLQEYDFDMVTIRTGDFTLPVATDLVQEYGSQSADEKGNSNYRGVKSKAVDRVLETMTQARTLEELRDAARALDRIVMWSHWQVPDVYAADERASYWDRFGMPAVRPKYFSIEAPSADQPPWAVGTWWIKDGAVR